jgi:ketosteroid isomerase-like protein
MSSPRLAVLSLLVLAACTSRDQRRGDSATPAAATLARAPAVDASGVRQAIDAQNARFSVALAKGDTATLASLYADSAIVMFSNQPAARGHDAIAKDFAGFVAAVRPSAITLHTQDLVVSGDYAIETGAYELTAPGAKGAKPMHDVGKYIVLWKKQPDGSYKLLRDIANSDLPMK